MWSRMPGAKYLAPTRYLTLGTKYLYQNFVHVPWTSDTLKTWKWSPTPSAFPVHNPSETLRTWKWSHWSPTPFVFSGLRSFRHLEDLEVVPHPQFVSHKYIYIYIYSIFFIYFLYIYIYIYHILYIFLIYIYIFLHIFLILSPYIYIYIVYIMYSLLAIPQWLFPI